ncbi:DUF6482 family protein [Alteromonas lipotrueiana]|uniref:DUF6482 family protein n=1 Tax=Alteromonas lipotrueiana TaxID=2803815 RepID=UPI001C43E4EA|nr:DUF6482 family protein [Alteromonas lipotrueiana]
MDKFFFKDVSGSSTDIERLEVQSFEINGFIVKVTVEGKSGMVFDKDEDRPKRFSNAAEVRKAFAKCNVKEAVMTYDSPYEEMVGEPEKVDSEMTMPFSMTEENE